MTSKQFKILNNSIDSSIYEAAKEQLAVYVCNAMYIEAHWAINIQQISLVQMLIHAI